MSKILVTGAGGYIGRAVVKTLLDLGQNVTAVDLVTDKVDSRADKLEYDIFNSNSNVFNNLGCPDICLHLAWKDGFCHNSVSHIDCLPAHYAFASNMISGGLSHLAVMGSMHEVGYHEGVLQEDTTANPESLYGIAKNALRQSLVVLNEQVPFVFQWLRGFYIYGEDSSNHSIFTKILQLEAMNEKIMPLNSGSNRYDFIHIDDLSVQIALAVLQSEINGVINCCSGKTVSLRDQVEMFIRDNNLKIRPSYGVFPDRPYDSPIIYGDAEKISCILKNALSIPEFNSAAKNVLLKLED